MTVPPVAHYLDAAATSDYLRPADWQNWADSRIAKDSEPEHWLIDVSLAKSHKELREAIDTKLQEERMVQPNVEAPFGDAVLGYYYLNFKKGKYDLEKLLNLAGEYADAGIAGIECEAIYGILNDVEQRRKTQSPVNDLIAAVAAIFEPFERIASEQFAALQAFQEGKDL